MLTLYLAPGSSSMAPHIALHEAGADFGIVPLSFRQREQREAAYMALNPAGKVPALVLDGGQPLTEVAAILWYVARRYPNAGLIPDGGLEAEARAIEWMSFIASGIHPATTGPMENRQVGFAIAEQRLGGREWALGSRMSVVDIHLFRLFWRNHGRAELAREQFPGLWGHHDRMMARPAVIRTCEIEAAIGYELPA